MKSPIPVIAIFDIGKTNKKIFLLDEYYVIQWQQTVQLSEISDEDGFACEDIIALTKWVKDVFAQLLMLPQFDLKAVNFSAYGASFVHLNKAGEPFLPLYNYLKPYPDFLLNNFFKTHGDKGDFTLATAAPVAGNLTSGFQLYRLKYQRQNYFELIDVSLHLPQYLSYILTGKSFSEITSIGCHTGLWNFDTHAYHSWVSTEKIDTILAPICSSDNCSTITLKSKQINIGVGLHDSSAALIPYLLSFQEPFVLISTGTWCVSLNPFNKDSLTEDELENDCCCYLSFNGQRVKAAKIFAGNEHENKIKELSAYFKKPLDYFTTIGFDNSIAVSLKAGAFKKGQQAVLPNNSASAIKESEFHLFENYEIAYHQLMINIVGQQVFSTNLILKNSLVKKIFVDGGFSKNKVYLTLLAQQFSNFEVYAATVSQASAMGVALAIHKHWNSKNVPENLIDLQLYSIVHEQ